MKKIFLIKYIIINKKNEEEHKMEDMNDRRRYVNGKPLLTLIFNLYNHIANNIFKKLYAQSINLCR